MPGKENSMQPKVQDVVFLQLFLVGYLYLFFFYSRFLKFIYHPWVKGTVSQDFLLQVFVMNLFQDPENRIRVISNFFENLRRYSQVKVHHRPPVSATPVASKKYQTADT